MTAALPLSFRIAQRSNDPKRRQALLKLLQASKAAAAKEQKPQRDAPKPEAPSLPPPPVPHLPMAPVLETAATLDDARHLNRAVMWEELARTQAEQ